MFVIYSKAFPHKIWREERTLDDIKNLLDNTILDIFPEHRDFIISEMEKIENEIKYYEEQINDCKKIKNKSEKYKAIRKCKTINILNKIRLNQFNKPAVIETVIKEENFETNK